MYVVLKSKLGVYITLKQSFISISHLQKNEECI